MTKPYSLAYALPHMFLYGTITHSIRIVILGNYGSNILYLKYLMKKCSGGFL